MHHEDENDTSQSRKIFTIRSEVFAVAFALLATGAVILTLNVLLLGGHIIFFQSLSVLGYCLFPLDNGALICMLKNDVIVKSSGGGCDIGMELMELMGCYQPAPSLLDFYTNFPITCHDSYES